MKLINKSHLLLWWEHPFWMHSKTTSGVEVAFLSTEQDSRR